MSTNSYAGILEQLRRNRAVSGAALPERQEAPQAVREHPAPLRLLEISTPEASRASARAPVPDAALPDAPPSGHRVFSLDRPPAPAGGAEGASGRAAETGFSADLRYPAGESAGAASPAPTAGDAAEALLERLEAEARLRPQAITDDWE